MTGFIIVALTVAVAYFAYRHFASSAVIAKVKTEIAVLESSLSADYVGAIARIKKLF